jgi:hypothetical protein
MSWRSSDSRWRWASGTASPTAVVVRNRRLVSAAACVGGSVRLSTDMETYLPRVGCRLPLQRRSRRAAGQEVSSSVRWQPPGQSRKVSHSPRRQTWLADVILRLYLDAGEIAQCGIERFSRRSVYDGRHLWPILSRGRVAEDHQITVCAKSRHTIERINLAAEEPPDGRVDRDSAKTSTQARARPLPSSIIGSIDRASVGPTRPCRLGHAPELTATAVHHSSRHRHVRNHLFPKNCRGGKVSISPLVVQRRCGQPQTEIGDQAGEGYSVSDVVIAQDGCRLAEW